MKWLRAHVRTVQLITTHIQKKWPGPLRHLSGLEFFADNFEQQRAESSCFFLKLQNKRCPTPNPFCGLGVALMEHSGSGSMVMTKAAVREEVSRASPTLQSHFTETGKDLFDLHDLLDPFGLIAGGSQSRRERRLFFFLSATCFTFYLPVECVQLCAQPVYVC